MSITNELTITEMKIAIQTYCKDFNHMRCVTGDCPLCIACDSNVSQFSEGDIVEMYNLIEITKSADANNRHDLNETIESMANEIAKYRYPKKYEIEDHIIKDIIKEFL